MLGSKIFYFLPFAYDHKMAYYSISYQVHLAGKEEEEGRRGQWERDFIYMRKLNFLVISTKASVHKLLARTMSYDHLWMREVEKYRWAHCHLK